MKRSERLPRPRVVDEEQSSAHELEPVLSHGPVDRLVRIVEHHESRAAHRAGGFEASAARPGLPLSYARLVEVVSAAELHPLAIALKADGAYRGLVITRRTRRCGCGRLSRGLGAARHSLVLEASRVASSLASRAPARPRLAPLHFFYLYTTCFCVPEGGCFFSAAARGRPRADPVLPEKSLCPGHVVGRRDEDDRTVGRVVHAQSVHLRRVSLRGERPRLEQHVARPHSVLSHGDVPHRLGLRRVAGTRGPPPAHHEQRLLSRTRSSPDAAGVRDSFLEHRMCSTVRLEAVAEHHDEVSFTRKRGHSVPRRRPLSLFFMPPTKN